MNVVFGSAARTHSSAGDISGAVAELFGNQPETRRFAGLAGVQTLGTISDNGAIVGSAVTEKAALVFIGAIHFPLDSWTGGSSPLDESGHTAHFLLERYLAVGRRFLDGVNGQYAVAIVDRESDSLLLATDPYGGRSWFVSEQGGELAFSSHLVSLAKSRGSALKVDRSLEDFLLIYGFYPLGRTPYAGIRALGPGTLLEWRQGNARAEAVVASNPWATGGATHCDKSTEAKVIDELHDAMVRATREQLPSRKQRVAVLLGGFDSALVASLIHQLGYEVETYSFHYQDATFNQPHVDELAAYLGTKHHWIEMDWPVVEKGIRDFSTTFNQPTNWPNYVLQTALVCEHIRRDGILHVYSGDGCDAIFLGYPGTYLRARVFAAMPVLPRWMQEAMLAAVARPSLDRWLGHPYRVILNMLRGLGRSMPARGYLSFRIMDEISLRQLRLSAAPSPEKPLDVLVEELSAPFASLPALRLAYQGKASVSPNRNKLIGSSDRTGLTILSPYMHPGLKNLVVNLPEKLMRPKEKSRSRVTGKYVLMKMAEEKGLLPNSIIYQKKVAAVDAPIDEWYAGPMRQTLLETFRGLPFEYDERYVGRLLDEKLSEKLFKRFVMTDKVISHAASLLATYATFTGVANPASDDSGDSRHGRQRP